MSNPSSPNRGSSPLDHGRNSSALNMGALGSAESGLGSARISNESLIASLADELKPVRSLTPKQGFALVALSFMLSLIFSAALGLRGDLSTSITSTIFVISTGLFFILGIASAVAVVTMAQPRVGTTHSGWIWAAAMAALLPFAALITTMSEPQALTAPHAVSYGFECLRNGLLLGIAVFAGLTLWLRRGAPTSPELAGMLVGVASGALGVAALAIHCPLNSIVHLGVWHSAAVVVSALIGRLVVPKLVRW